jgi:hemolysin activation/secretion protein
LKKRIILLFVMPICMFAASPTDEAFRQQKADERAKAIQELQPKAQDVMLDATPGVEVPKSVPQDEKPCFYIKPEDISLQGEEAGRFGYALEDTLKTLHYSNKGECIGIQGINTIMSLTQNRIIDDGYVTTRVLLEPQDLSSGTLKYSLIAGRVDDVRVLDKTSATSLKNSMPTSKDKLLNLRDIEQGLENLRRLPTASATMQITPSGKAGYSDIVIDYKHRIPFRVTLSMDDAGSKSTGKIQGGATLAWDNPLGLNDIFYIGYTRDIGDRSSVSLNNDTRSGGSNNRALHYSIPFGYWLLSFNESKYDYEQMVAGASQIYNYNGNSITRELELKRVLYRDDTIKFSTSLIGWQKSSNNFIDDAELTVQRRKTAGYEIGFDLRKYLGSAVLDLSAYYKRGTGAFGALRAPEESYNGGTSRMQIYTFNASIIAPFVLGEKNFAYNTSLKFQYNATPLTPQDRLSIGGRYTVRGFDGEYTLSSDRGVIWRNELEWSYVPTHKMYIALDGGYVSGENAKYLMGQSLVGGALGLRGQLNKFGTIGYDFFVGLPIYAPKNFPKKSVTGGFSINYNF